MAEMFIQSFMKGDEKFCKMVLKITQDPIKLQELSKLCCYVYEKGLADSIDKILP